MPHHCHPSAIVSIVFAAALVCGSFTVTSPTAAEDNRTFKERKHDRAKQVRRDSAARARSLLGRDALPEQDDNVQAIDFYSLSLQIQRLGAVLQAMAHANREQPTGLPGLPGPLAGSQRDLYGPSGPTVKSVSALLNYRLTVLGNPRLGLGRVTESDESVMAEIVTVKEGTVVEQYVIDKRTGAWDAVR